MRLKLEFLPRRPSRWRWAPVALSCLCVAALLVRFRTEQQSVAQITARIAVLREHIRQNESARAAAARPGPDAVRTAAAKQALIARLRYPWGQVLSNVEQADMPDVAVLSFMHTTADEVSELTVEAREAPAIDDYLGRLNGDSDAAQWYVASWQPQPGANPPVVKATIRRLLHAPK